MTRVSVELTRLGEELKRKSTECAAFKAEIETRSGDDRARLQESLRRVLAEIDTLKSDIAAENAALLERFPKRTEENAQALDEGKAGTQRDMHDASKYLDDLKHAKSELQRRFPETTTPQSKVGSYKKHFRGRPGATTVWKLHIPKSPEAKAVTEARAPAGGEIPRPTE